MATWTSGDIASACTTFLLSVMTIKLQYNRIFLNNWVYHAGNHLNLMHENFPPINLTTIQEAKEEAMAVAIELKEIQISLSHRLCQTCTEICKGSFFLLTCFLKPRGFVIVMALMMVAAVASVVMVTWEQRKKRTSHDCMVGWNMI